MRKSNYDKFPATAIEGEIWQGWQGIRARLQQHVADNVQERYVIAVECYQGVMEEELATEFAALSDTTFINTQGLFRDEAEIEAMTRPYVTDDRLFGYRSHFSYNDFFNAKALDAFRTTLTHAIGCVLVYGHGAAVAVPDADLLVYADMPRWEIQQRYRRHEVKAIGVDNSGEEASRQYKRGYFVDWIVCDNLKRQIMAKAHYWLDTTLPQQPKMITGQTLRSALEKTAGGPFRLVPFFDPAPWGGQWMKEVCGLNPEVPNYGWCFDCVPEENSLYLSVNGVRFEIPSQDLVIAQTRRLLGSAVEARFGVDFPIRFDFLDTMGGGNLSLQVHPTTQYIRDTFGMIYTQDESYYLLDAEEGATVFLGLKPGVDPQEMVSALEAAQEPGGNFDALRFVNQWPAAKHDHFLIPAGTIHCSGAGAMVLEISATPSIFTFKLWDWGRLGLDGRLLTGDNDVGGDVWCLPGKRYPDMLLEESVSIRAVKRVYSRLTGDTTELTPKDIFDIAEGNRLGDTEAARHAFAEMGEMAGYGIATAVTLIDGLVVIGGGISRSHKYFMPALLGEMRRCLGTFAGSSHPRVQSEVFSLDTDMEDFVRNRAQKVSLSGSAGTVYDPLKRIGVGITRQGTSRSISIGAYMWAIDQMARTGKA